MRVTVGIIVVLGSPAQRQPPDWRITFHKSSHGFDCGVYLLFDLGHKHLSSASMRSDVGASHERDSATKEKNSIWQELSSLSVRYLPIQACLARSLARSSQRSLTYSVQSLATCARQHAGS